MIAPALASQILALRAAATSQSVPCGMLAWWGRSDFPDGVDEPAAPSPALSQADWEAWYLRLQQASLVPGAVPPLYAVKGMTGAMRPDGPLPVAIANFRVAVPRSEFVARVTRAAGAGIALDPAPGGIGTLIDERRAFFACGLLHDQWGTAAPAYRGRSVTYLLDRRFYFSNAGDPPPDEIELDPGDGRGYRSLRFGERVTAHYGAGDRVSAAVRCRGPAGVVHASFSVALGAQPAPPEPDETWALQGANGNTGTAYVYLADGQSQLTHPLIVAEGFPGGYPYVYLYEMLNQHGTLEALNRAGYDVILLGFANGFDLIQNNAQVAVACIQQAMRRTPGPLVASGVSMGGLIMRYALTDMESRGLPHHTRIFLTIDTPHRGAYTNLCDQWFAHYFAGSSPMASAQSMALNSPANQQFVMTWVNGSTAQASPLRQQFLQALEKIGGYPKQPRRLAVACGSGDGRRTLAPHQPALDWSGSPFASAQLWTLPEDGANSRVIAEGYSLLADEPAPASFSVASGVSWEGAPGGQNIYNLDCAAIAQSIGCGTVSNPVPRNCSVPTVSALDLATDPFEPVPPPGGGASPFDDYVCCECNQLHLQFTPRIKRWLLDRLGAPSTQPVKRTQVKSMNTSFDPSTFEPHDPAFLADPYPVYAQFRAQAPAHRVMLKYGPMTLYDSTWIFRFADVKTVLDDKALYLKNQQPPHVPPAPFDVLQNMPNGVFSLDPPRHDELRTILDPLFAQAIGDMDAAAEAIAKPLLDAAKASRRIELVSAYAKPLPSNVLKTVLGISDDDWHRGIEQWVGGVVEGNDYTKPVAAQVMGGTCALALGAYFQALTRGCPMHTEKGRMIDLMVGKGEAAGMLREEVQQTLVNLAIAGYMSTVFLVATGTLNLLRNPSQLALLRKQPELMGKAIEEMLRFDAPAQLVDRFVARDTEIAGVKLKANDKVTAVLGSANRDPDAFANPDVFDITRDSKIEHVGFGDGIHYCLGAPLVRKVVPVAFRLLLSELPELALDGLPQWQTDPYLRSVVNLPVAIG